MRLMDGREFPYRCCRLTGERDPQTQEREPVHGGGDVESPSCAGAVVTEMGHTKQACF